MRGTVVFDLDGTLADTAADLIASANACFKARGLGALLDPAADAGIAFHGGRAMLRAGYARMPSDTLLPPGAEDADLAHLLDYYGADIARHTRLYPGVTDALDALIADGYLLSICTNKPEGLAETLMAALGVRDRFASLVGADTMPVRKPDPRPYALAVERAGGTVSQSFLVGDTDTDLRTARAAGVRIALVGFGPEAHAVSRLKADHVLAEYAALPALARAWLTGDDNQARAPKA